MDKINIAVAYERTDGKRYELAPFGSHLLDSCRPVYREVAGWRQATAGIRHFEQLPAAAQEYLRLIEDMCDTPIDVISTGPERDDIILRRSPFE
jgi:adenylosuccinate synthase